MRASGRSTLLTTRITGRWFSSALRSTKRVWGSGPSDASTSSSTPSTIVSPRSTSPPKSACPGVSTMLSLTSPYWTAVFLARIVMPFSRSRSIESITRSATSWLARKAPDCHSIASTSVVLPWSTWAMIATLRRSSRRIGRSTLTRFVVERYGGRVVGPHFGTVRREAVPQQIVTRLLDLIQQRHLGPGDRLPAERDLAATMGVSRSSLREALRALTVLGVTEMRHGTGTYVSSLEPDLLVRPLSFVLSLSDGGFDQLFEARKVVEPAIASLAADRIDDGTLDRLDALAMRAGAVVESAEAFLVADVELHDAIRHAAGNAILGRFMESIQALGVA